MKWFIDDKDRDADTASLRDVFNIIKTVIKATVGTSLSVTRLKEAQEGARGEISDINKAQAAGRKADTAAELANWEKTGCATAEAVPVMKQLRLKNSAGTGVAP